jgi:hypothetical protein
MAKRLPVLQKTNSGLLQVLTFKGHVTNKSKSKIIELLCNNCKDYVVLNEMCTFLQKINVVGQNLLTAQAVGYFVNSSYL